MAAEQKDLWLLGKISTKIAKSKLPSKRNVLKVLLYNLSKCKSISKSVEQVASEVISLWNTYGLECIRSDKVRNKILKLHGDYNLLKKNSLRKAKSDLLREAKFKKNCGTLFDISHGKFETLVNSKQKVDFLKDQRHKRALKLNSLPVSNSKIKKTQSDDLMYDVEPSTEDSTEEDDPRDDYLSVDTTPVEENTGHQASSVLLNQIIQSPAVLSTLDRINLSSGKFRLLMGAIGKEIKADSSKSKVSRATMERYRKKNRTRAARTIKKKFIKQFGSRPCIIHWDGKLLSDTTNLNVALRKKKVDRIAITVTSNKKSKLLGIPKIENGTGLRMAESVFDEITKWELTNVVGMCTDTTNSNTGWKMGACTRLQRDFLKEELIYFPCRHHVFEVVLAEVFAASFGISTGPDIKMFQEFRENWTILNLESEVHGLPDTAFSSTFLKQMKTETIECIQKFLSDESSYIPRGDYRELCDLTLLILGVKNYNYRFRVPGALHHARWMCKLIYAFKIYLLRKQMTEKLSNELLASLEQFCLFCSVLYVKQWLLCPLLPDAAINDLQFYKNLVLFQEANKKISDCAITKLNGQLWYLGPELASFALFSKKVSSSEKQNIINKMKKSDGHWKRLLIPQLADVHTKSISDFITSRSLLSIYKISPDALKFMFHNSPTAWPSNPEFKKVKKMHFEKKNISKTNFNFNSLNASYRR